jgi:hypothetical protein
VSRRGDLSVRLVFSLSSFAALFGVGFLNRSVDGGLELFRLLVAFCDLRSSMVFSLGDKNRNDPFFTGKIYRARFFDRHRLNSSRNVGESG